MEKGKPDSEDPKSPKDSGEGSNNEPINLYETVRRQISELDQLLSEIEASTKKGPTSTQNASLDKPSPNTDPVAGASTGDSNINTDPLQDTFMDDIGDQYAVSIKSPKETLGQTQSGQESERGRDMPDISDAV